MATLWGAPFGAVEQYNRRVAFIAAYRVAVETKNADPAAFAKKAVEESQGIYNKGNRPQWARSAPGALLMTFKQFPIMSMENMVRMWRSGPEGKTAVALMLTTMAMVGGLGGLPGADDLDDLLTGIGGMLGYNNGFKEMVYRKTVSTIGKGMADALSDGLTGIPGSPIDISGRMSMGNLIPGTGVFRNLFKGEAAETRDVAEVLGPAGDVVKRIYQGIGLIADGNVMAGLTKAAPLAAQNTVKGIKMAQDGVYKDDRGNTVVQTNNTEAFLKGIGFQPGVVKDAQDASRSAVVFKLEYERVQQKVNELAAKSRFNKDPDLLKKASDIAKNYNEKNEGPDIRVNYKSVNRLVQNMRLTREERLIKNAPRKLRETLRDQMNGGDDADN